MADRGLKRLKELAALFKVRPGSAVTLPRDFDPGFTADFGKDDADRASNVLRQGTDLLAEYQDRLAAQETYAVLVVLQGLDASGKDSTIKHVMSGVNPQWVDVHAFKVPSTEELSHDFLWRYARKLPVGEPSASSIARTTKRCWSFGSIPICSTRSICLRTRGAPDSGRGDSRRSTSGSTTSSTTASTLPSCS